MNTWEEPLDPGDTMDYQLDVSSLLEPGESVASYTVTVPAESALQGLALGTAAYAHSRSGNIITVWLKMTSTPSESLTLPVEFTITTNSTPPRIKQRSVAVKVEEQ